MLTISEHFSPGKTDSGKDPSGFPFRLVLIIRMAAILLFILIKVGILVHEEQKMTLPTSCGGNVRWASQIEFVRAALKRRNLLFLLIYQLNSTNF